MKIDTNNKENLCLKWLHFQKCSFHCNEKLSSQIVNPKEKNEFISKFNLVSKNLDLLEKNILKSFDDKESILAKDGNHKIYTNFNHSKIVEVLKHYLKDYEQESIFDIIITEIENLLSKNVFSSGNHIYNKLLENGFFFIQTKLITDDYKFKESIRLIYLINKINNKKISFPLFIDFNHHIYPINRLHTNISKSNSHSWILNHNIKDK